jgi:glycosyltransferase involved in cell wall biosynthesis
MSTVSYIFTTKNRDTLFENSIIKHSELKRTGDEFIVIDGNSTDNTHEIIKKYEHLFDKIIIEDDTCFAHAFNKGILSSSCEYIKQVSDDDLLLQDGLYSAIDIMDANQEIDILVCGGVRIEDDDETYFVVPDNVKYGLKESDVCAYGACGIGHIYRRSSIPIMGLLDVSLMPVDQEIIMRAITNQLNVKFFRCKVFKHYISNLSTSLNKKRIYDFSKLYFKYGLYYYSFRNYISIKFKFIKNIYISLTKYRKNIMINKNNFDKTLSW